MSLFESGPASSRDTATQHDEQTTMTTTLMSWGAKERVAIFKAGENIKKTTLEKIFSLRFKTLIVLILFFSLVVVAFCAVLFGVFPVKFLEIENDRVVDGYQRTTNFLSFYLRFLSSYASNTGYIITNNSPDFVIEQSIPSYNGSDPTIQYYNAIGLNAVNSNYIAYYRLDGSLFYQIGFTNKNDSSVFFLPLTGLNSVGQLKPGIHPLLLKNTTDFRGVALYGYQASTQSLALLMTSAPIYNTINVVVGWIILGKIQDIAFVQEMADTIQMCSTLLSWSDIAVRKKYVNLLKTAPVYPSLDVNWNVESKTTPEIYNLELAAGRCCRQNGQSLPYSDLRTGSFLVYDAFGKPSFIYRVDIQTSNLYIGLVGVFICFAVLIVGIILVVIVIVVFMDRAILNRVKVIMEQLEKITIDRNVKARLVNLSKNGDEINILGTCVNKMLQSLENATEKIYEVLNKTLFHEERSRNMMKALNDFVVCVLLKDGSIQEANPSFQEKFRFSPSQSRGTVSIEKFLSKLKLSDLHVLSVNGLKIDSELITGFNLKIPVTISASPCTLVVDEEPMDALVIIAQNKTEQKDMARKLKNVQDDLIFTKMWDDPVGRQEFYNYCVKERSTENVKFLQQVEIYKMTKAVDERVKLQNKILQQFLLPSSEELLNLSAKILEKELPLVKEGYAQRDLFNNLEGFVRNMVVSDTFSRYMDQKSKEQRNSVHQ